jgi:hypothetical protein
MVEAQDGDAINREREATAVDDRVKNGLEVSRPGEWSQEAEAWMENLRATKGR